MRFLTRFKNIYNHIYIRTSLRSGDIDEDLMRNRKENNWLRREATDACEAMLSKDPVTVGFFLGR